ncbi:hypothetical protein VNI00_002661 [Paramarasmius palmivorus]|uniref:Cyclopropane-fatty-acyl-phospholipid synthase n=1 Tax=Paramarasmius palmivorus TaxID=297713 RepID=A0AAW0DWZ4_9AGAR
MGDLGFSESYMYGEVSLPHTDLIPLFRLFLANRPYLSTIDGSSWVSTPQRVLNGIWARNTLTGSRKNISAHYDISNRMFEGFLSRDMTYSCALWDEVDGDLVGGGEEENVEGILRIGSTQKPAQTFTQAAGKDEEDPLYEAQMNKLRYIISLLRIPTDTSEPIRVLEIGSGWGSLSILLASTYPHVHIDTLTLSTQQKSLADERIRASGLSDRVKVHFMDYRQIPVEWKGKFHRVVSVEMVEAVGEAYLSTYFAQIDQALHPTRGIGVVQSITIPEARFKNYQKEVDFIQKWIFPGGFLPSLTVLMNAMELGSAGRLTVDGVRNIGVHYARTLREWRRRFLGRFEEVVRPALEEERGVKGEEEVEVFKRKWIYWVFGESAWGSCVVFFEGRVWGYEEGAEVSVEIRDRV